MHSGACAFHPAVDRWFRSAFEQPTAAQAQGWAQIAAGRHTLIEAPTGSGKTLAAFLWCLNDLVCRPPAAPGVQVLYISPLKALNNDIQRNLDAPLAGLRAAAAELDLAIPDIQVGVRTGDTPPALRARQIRRPPEIFITTPESLYLLLTSSRGQTMFRTLRYLILDEIHAVASTKRGVHLALSIERLEALVAPTSSRTSDYAPPASNLQPPTPSFVRIGLSATQRPLETVARLLGGYDDDGAARPVSIVQAQQDKRIEMDVTYPLGEPADEGDFMHRSARLILDEAARHRSTLVFCNARHVTERLAEVINQTAGCQMAVAHHGSISREQRLETEQALKNGTLPLLVATSSLELGIDVGSVDLVIQVGSTRSVSRALQRIGRAGHQVGAVSRGRVLAQHPSDLLDAAACGRGLRRRNIEPTHVPQLCLDVLAQHIVAMTAAQSWTAADLLSLARRAQPFHSLSREQLESVLAMLAGRYADLRFDGLRPRIEWDAGAGEVRGLPGALRLAVINGGTIPDRGYLSVELMPGAEGQPGKKLGELDEEFAAELYVGGRPAFSLGTSVWGVESVERDRVIVRPAPGQPYQIPFWRGDRLGRSADYGAPQLVRELALRLRTDPCPTGAEPSSDSLPAAPATAVWLHQECGLDEGAAGALVDYVRRQEEATGVAPSDQAILIESFQDEIGDGRVVIHSLFGSAVNGAWAFALKPRLRQALGGIDPLVMHNDDGIILRLPPMELAVEPFVRELLEGVRADTVEELLIGELADAPMLALRFREAAQRALLLPKLRPDRRTPLWLRRQRAADLLSIVRRKEGFPVLQEAVRECLHDTWDLNGLRAVLRGIEAGEIGVPFVETRSPSPFAGSLVWDFGLAFGEEGDAPRGECRAAYLALNRDLLRETLEAENLRQLLDADVIADVEAQLAAACAAAPAAAGAAPTAAGGALPARGPQRDQAVRELLHAHMQTSGPASAACIAECLQLPQAEVRRQLNHLVEASQLSCGEYLPDGHEQEYCAPLILARLHRESLRRARQQLAPVDAASYAAFLPLWQGLGQAGAASRRSLAALLHLPLTRDHWQALLIARYGDDFAAAVDALTSRGLLHWRSAAKGKIELVEPGAGAPLEAGLLGPADEPRLPTTVPAPAGLPHLRPRSSVTASGSVHIPDAPEPDSPTPTASGSVRTPDRALADLYVGLMSSATSSGSARPSDASSRSVGVVASGFAHWPGDAGQPPLPAAEHSCSLAGTRSGAWGQRAQEWHAGWQLAGLAGLAGTGNGAIAAAAGGRAQEAPLGFGCERVMDALRRSGALFTADLARRFSRADPPLSLGDVEHALELLERAGLVSNDLFSRSGRWSVLDRQPNGSIEAYVEALLKRYGVVCREACRAEKGQYRWADVERILKVWEWRGRVLRGDFVRDLTGPQFAPREAVELLRQAPAGDNPPLLLAWEDPANPWGAMLPLAAPRGKGRFILVLRGQPLLTIAGWGRDLRPARGWCDELAGRVAPVLKGLAQHSPSGQAAIERWHGGSILVSPLAAPLREAGFIRAGLRLVHRPPRAAHGIGLAV